VVSPWICSGLVFEERRDGSTDGVEREKGGRALPERSLPISKRYNGSIYSGGGKRGEEGWNLGPRQRKRLKAAEGGAQRGRGSQRFSVGTRSRRARKLQTNGRGRIEWARTGKRGNAKKMKTSRGGVRGRCSSGRLDHATSIVDDKNLVKRSRSEREARRKENLEHPISPYDQEGGVENWEGREFSKRITGKRFVRGEGTKWRKRKGERTGHPRKRGVVEELFRQGPARRMDSTSGFREAKKRSPCKERLPIRKKQLTPRCSRSHGKNRELLNAGAGTCD